MPTSLPHETPLASAQATPACLYVVATPIGHLADISERAREVLCTVPWVACEDTRTTRVLLNHLGAGAQTFAYHQHNERGAAERIVALVRSGHSVALVSDAGTPAVSDPGAEAVRLAHDLHLSVVPIPGASAVTTLLSACGFNAEQGFYFAGFLPQTASKRRTRLQALQEQAGIIVLYEAPHRIEECLADCLDVFGADRQIVIGRELTKRFEQIARMPLADCAAWLAADANRLRGEFVLALEARPASERQASTNGLSLDTLLRHLLDELPASASAKLAHKLLGVERAHAYERAAELSASAAKRKG
jgi:16S rRNA (cytidine1402-2'-O)-methyltransferase